jgi:Ran GTPase-activating protein (RanGAP) involved in mRNA processing and transport
LWYVEYVKIVTGRVIGEGMMFNQHLEVLNLSGNNLGDECALALAQALRLKDNALINLDLSSNDMEV